MSLDRVEQPSSQSGLSPIWDDLLKRIARGIRGLWGGYEYTPTLSGTGSVSTMKFQRMGSMAWFTVSLSDTSGSGSVTLPANMDGNHAFIGYGTTSYGNDGEAKAYFVDASGSVIITGIYKVKEG